MRQTRLPLTLILDHEIFGAIESIEKEAVPEIRDALSMIKKNYTFLSEYFVNGGNDPERSRLLSEMSKSLAILRYKNEILKRGKYGYSEPSHHVNVDGETSPIMALIQRLQGEEGTPRFAVVETLFDKLWQAPALSNEEVSAVRYVMTDGEDTFVARTLVGALFLGLSVGIEQSKYSLLLEACRHSDLSVRMSALPALLMVSKACGDELMTLYPDLWDKAQDVVSTDIEAEELFAACNAIFSAYRTEEDHRIFVERIEPQLNDIAQKMNFLQGDDLFERLKSAEKSGEASEIERTVLEIQEELPRDRDLTFHTIHKMKGYPFFDSIPRFFLPWDKRHPAVNEENAEAFEKLLPMTFREGMVCSSDCYSFVSIGYWKQFSEILSSGLPDLTGVSMYKDADYYSKDFVFGLYRFVKLSSWGRVFPDPFGAHTNVLDHSLMSRLYDTPHAQVLRKIIERLVTLKEHNIAIQMAEALLTLDPDDTHLRRILTVIYYREELYEKAKKCLEHIVNIEGLAPSIALRLGELYERWGEGDKAFDLYTKAYATAPEDSRLAQHYAERLIERERYDEALKVLYALFFATDGKAHRVVYLLSDALLMTGKAQEALERLSELPEEDDKTFINKQIARILLNERAGALSALAPWCKESDTRALAFATKAKSVLTACAWDKTDISLLIDALTLSISKL